MKKLIKLLILLTSISSFMVVGENTLSDKLEFIQKGIEYNIKQIQNIEIEFESILMGKENIRKIKGKFFLKDGNKALEGEIYENEELKDKFKVTYSNSIGKSLHYENIKKGIPCSGSILSSEPPEFVYNYPARLFLEIFGEDMVKVIKNGNLKLIGEEKLDGQDCFVLSGEVGKWKEYKIWIDYNRSYRPLRIELVYKPKNEKYYTVLIENIVLKKILDTWIPVYGEIKSDNPDIIPVKIKVLKVEINKEIPKEVFDIKYPPGTGINDKISGTSYYVK